MKIHRPSALISTAIASLAALPLVHAASGDSAPFLVDSRNISGSVVHTVHSDNRAYLTVDSVPGSLRQAIANAASGEVVDFDGGLSGETIVLGGSQLTLDKNLAIDASALARGIKVSGDNASRVIGISPESNALLKGLSIIGGNAQSESGGGIRNQGFAELENCVISGNVGHGGGGVETGPSAFLSITNSTLSGNVSGEFGGGLFNRDGEAFLRHVTVSDNSSTEEGGGIANSGFLHIENTIVAQNNSDSGIGTDMRIVGGPPIIITPEAVEASSEIGAPFDRQADFIIDGSGLSGEGGDSHTTVPDSNMWLSTGSGFGGVDADPFVIFDLGAVYRIHSFRVWNYNEGYGPGSSLTNRGVDSVTVEFGKTGALGSAVDGITNFAQADGTPDYMGELFELSTPFAAQFIKFDIHSNHGDGASFYGLSEVQFFGEQINATITREGANLIGDNESVESDFSDGLPNTDGDWVGTAASPLDSLLAPLGDYGGRTETMPPLPGSPAIEGALFSGVVTDQRGNPRPTGPLPDIGAVEAGSLLRGMLADSDNDGIPDVLEGSDGPYPHLLVGVDDSGVDTDGDGSTDAEEIGNMTDLNDARDYFRVLGFALSPGFDPLTNPLVSITFSSFPGLDYEVETDNALGTFEPVPGSLRTADDFTETVEVLLESGAKSFGRVGRR